MSTKFAIHRHKRMIPIFEDMPDFSGIDKEDLILVFIRGNNNKCSYLNELVPMLKEDVMVYAIDNTQQGIFTIGDIVRYLEV